VLVIGTLHSNSASRRSTHHRRDPEESRDQVRSTLSVLLRGVVSQHLAQARQRRGAGGGDEVLLRTTPISNLSAKNKTFQIGRIPRTSSNDGSGMQSLDACLQAAQAGRNHRRRSAQVRQQPESLKRSLPSCPRMMDAKARDKAAGRDAAWRKGGQGDAAAKLFREAGAVEESARVLGIAATPARCRTAPHRSLGWRRPRRAGSIQREEAALMGGHLPRARRRPPQPSSCSWRWASSTGVELPEVGDAVGAAKIAAMSPVSSRPVRCSHRRRPPRWRAGGVDGDRAEAGGQGSWSRAASVRAAEAVRRGARVAKALGRTATPRSSTPTGAFRSMRRRLI